MDRSFLGLPPDWRKVGKLLANRPRFPIGWLPAMVMKKPAPRIPIMKLEDYLKSPPKSFWARFPKNDLPVVPSCSVNIPEMEKFLEESKGKLKQSAYERCKRSIENFKEGAPLAQKGPLPACFVKNSRSAYIHGEKVTETIANWVDKKFVSGPFDSPPLKNFRVNPLSAIDQGSKIRPVLDVSAPKGASLNDNMNELCIEKVFMSTARRFSYSLFECGKNAIMSKFDFVDAFKIIPAKLNDLRCQGFSWLNKYFLENRQIFGAKTSVPNFDIFANSIKVLANADLKIPEKFFHRTLDDIPLVAPYHKDWCVMFSNSLIGICSALNVPLASECPNNEKAFVCKTQGKVLGLFFDSVNLTWKFPDDKYFKYLNFVFDILARDKVSLKDMQSLMGILNNICLMAVFLDGFKFNLYEVLKRLIADERPVSLPRCAYNDLCVFANFLSEGNLWRPIVPKYCNVPLSHFQVISDASGKYMEKDTGCGLLVINDLEEICLAYQFFWPAPNFLLFKDEKGSTFSNKTCTLEFVGILIPFLICPEYFINQHVVVKVDNVACFYGWINRKVANDSCASIIVRALHLISAYLACMIHIEHLPRLSTGDACTVDRLSRRSTTLPEDEILLSSFDVDSSRLEPLIAWLSLPVEDWTLPDKLLCSVIKTCEGLIE
jgi:hypothetical protein